MKEQARLKIRIMLFTLVISVILMGVKFFSYFITGSNAILTDAIESVVNILAGGFALYSIYYAAKPKDSDHPYGHGRIEFFSSGFEGGMITLAGIAMIFKGCFAFIRKDVVHEADIGAYLSAATGLVNFITGRYLVAKGRKYNSTVMTADGKHLISDAVSSAGLVIGLFLIYFTKIYWLDYIITIIFGGFIIYSGYKLLSEAVTSLLDKADLVRLQHLVDILQQHRRPKWIDIHNLRVLKYGSHLHVDCHITLPWYDKLEESHKEVSLVEKLVREKVGDEIEFFIHADPCIPASCPVCSLHDCPVRRAAFQKRLDWTLENVLPDRKHGVEN